MCGETLSGINILLVLYFKLKELDKFRKINKDTNAQLYKLSEYEHVYDFDEMKIQIKNMITKLFKEIEADIHLIRLLLELFPDIKIILNYRLDHSIQHKEIIKEFQHFHSKNKDKSFIFLREDINNFNKIKELYTFLNSDTYFNREVIKNTLDEMKELYKTKKCIVHHLQLD